MSEPFHPRFATAIGRERQQARLNEMCLDFYIAKQPSVRIRKDDCESDHLYDIVSPFDCPAWNDD